LRPEVTLADRFATHRYRLTRPRRLCAPSDKNGEGIRHRDAHLLCYGARVVDGAADDAIVGVGTANQFGAGGLDARPAVEVCVPAQVGP
jgi:hypothetical protein